MPWLLYHRERDPVHTVLEVGQLQGQVSEILPVSGFDPQIIQLLAGHYTNHAIPGHSEKAYLTANRNTNEWP
jgi:hypothetical protein